MINDQSQNQKNGIVTSCVEHYFKTIYKKKNSDLEKKTLPSHKNWFGLFTYKPYESNFLHDNQNLISDDLLDLETQKYAFRLILEWEFQKWSQFYEILKIRPPAVTSH